MVISITNNIVDNGDKILFKSGESFKFDKEVNIISGLNGSGKTTLLKLIRSHNSLHEKNSMIKNELEKIKPNGMLDGEYSIFSYFASEDDAQGILTHDMGSFLELGGLHRSKSSQGESIEIALAILISNIKKYKKENPKAKIYILLDEPTRNMDFVAKYNFATLVKRLSSIGKVILSTHNFFILGIWDSYNLNLRKMSNYNDMFDTFNNSYKAFRETKNIHNI